ncbi:E3 ubiquitin-protein ligase TRIM32 [Nerophis ophidion]|uniref:E3 ubiquitin-protein ligase TRIM32 n=1 Tax=Nerophis ophidion TaxID=159077 RepID=UPI002AE0038E|nr:E3 ubiquitin-protein ligase TRIM32 [Nerophis ophidion]XP_061732393.1 E3 ubiquitin-protein ligase TRIM32 [Nerophis ophidion]
MATASYPLDADLMREVLECPICLETFNEDQLRPKLLQCGHTVCRHCLEKLLANTINGVRCPFCSKVSRMSSISQLADNLTVLKILDCTTSCSAAASALMCGSCCNRLPRQYCHDCAIVVCELCKGEGHLHKGHSVQLIRMAAEQRRKELGSKLSTLCELMSEIQKKKTAIENISKSLRAKYRAVQQDYTTTEMLIQDELSRSRTAFRASLAEMQKINGQVLEKQTYLLNIAEVKVVSCCDYLNMRVRQSDISLLKDDGGGCDDEDLNLRSSLPTVFQLQEPELVQTEESKPIQVGHLTTSTYTVSTDNAECRLEVALEGDSVGVDRALGGAVAIYRDVEMVAAGDETLRSSPGTYKSKSMDAGGGSEEGACAGPSVCQFVKKMGCKGTLPGSFNLPIGICVSKQGEVLVADRSNYRIQIFNRKGFQREIRRNASSIDNFVLSVLGADLPNLMPLSIAVTPQGLIGVTDNYDNSVKVYTMDGQCIACHKNRLIKPWGITAMPSGQFVVSDVEGDKLWCIAVDRNVGVVSCNRLCSAVRPKFVTCDAAGTVYFTQGMALNFEKRHDEAYLEGGFSIGSVGIDGVLGKQHSHFFAESERFCCITGMCVDTNGDLLVTDSGRKEILQFPKDGGFKVLIQDGLNYPVGVATTPKGQLLVLDYWDHCVKVYTYMQRRHSSTS